MVISLLSGTLSAETHITGDITNMTFEPGGNPYIVEQDILVPEQGKVTIKGGCVFLFKPFTGLTVQGNLTVEGTTGQTVVFTSINDGEFNPQSEQLPNPFDWNGILISRESGTVLLQSLDLRFSVYGIKSQKTDIRIENGLFRQNGQFHFTINDKIQFVQDNIPYSYDGNMDAAAPAKPDPATGVPGKNKDRGRTATQIIRYSCLGAGIAGSVVGVVFGINAGSVLKTWNEESEGDPDYPSEQYNKRRKEFSRNVAATVIGSSIGVLGFTGFGISFAF